MNKRQRPVDKISIRTQQFSIMAVDVLPPRKICIFFLWAICQKIIPDWIRVIPFYQVLDPDCVILACGNFSTLQCHVFTGYDLIWQMPSFSICNEQRRQNNCMKGYIIFAMHIIVFCVFSPQSLLIESLLLCRASTRRQIAQHILCPDINCLFLISCSWNWDSPR